MQEMFHGVWRDGRIAVPIAVFLLCLGIGLLIRRLVLGGLSRISKTGTLHIGSIVADAIRTPLLLWALIAGADLASRSSRVPAKYVHQIDVTLLALWIISLTMLAAKLIGNVVRFYGSHVTGQAAASATLSRNLAQIVVYTLGMLILLNHIGIDIRPLLTALGVGGLAVALALQETMANLFAGFYISVAGQIRLNDYIKLNSGEEGYVVDITWRSTTLRALSNNVIFVPNSKLGQANVTNFNLPEQKMGSSVMVRIAYDADADRVERLLLDEARTAAKEITGIVATDPVTVTWSPGFADSALVLSVNYNVVDFVSQFGVQSEMRRRLFRRLNSEGVSMTVPTEIVRTVSTPDPSSAGTAALNA